MLARELSSFARLYMPILAPPRRAGRVPVVALSWWLQRIPPDLVSGPSTCPLAPLRRPDCSIYEVMSSLAGGVHLRRSVFSVGSWGIRKKTRGRAGTPDAGALLFKELLLSGWGYRVTPGVSPGRSPLCALKDKHSLHFVPCI